MKVIYQNTGLHWALGMEGNTEEIETFYNSLFNHGAIEKSADLKWLGKKIAYVWTTQERLQKYFKNASYHEVLNNVDANPDSPEWIHKAEERYNEMEPEIFLGKCSRFTEEYQIGTL